MKAAVYCGTRNLYSDMVTAAKSLAMNSSVDMIYFLIEDPEFPEPLPDYIQCIDVSNQRYFPPGCPNVYSLWSYMVLMRAVLSKYFPHLDRILSLDVDTIVDQNIDELWDLDLNNCYLAGVREPGKSTTSKPYVNMGVVMFNLNMIRANGMDDRFIRVLNNTRFRFAEQDCINSLCFHWYKLIPSIYNLNDWTDPCKDPKIVHFANSRGAFRKEPLVEKYRKISWDDIPRSEITMYHKPVNKTRYMIHSSPQRQWYVKDFLVPSMLEQGIKESDIIIQCDVEKKGNLISCMEAFKYCGDHPVVGGTWHLQDDVIICHDFAEKTRFYNDGVVCGAVVKEWGPDATKTGIQPVKELWYSFPCIRIPDEIAGECAKWFFEDASKRNDSRFRTRIIRKKHDDDFFQFFLFEKYPSMTITNLKPNITDHIDYLIGGSIVNAERKTKVNRSAYFEDGYLVDRLEKSIKDYWKKSK